MEQDKIKVILEKISEGVLSVEEGLLALKREPFEEIGMASLDYHRGLRQGVSEVIYGEGKTIEDINKIAKTLWENEQKTIIITRMSQEKAKKFREDLPFYYYEKPRLGLVGEKNQPKKEGYILVVSAGTSDIPVAEEAALTAEILGNRVKRIHDVGVAGLHRLLAHLDELMEARVIIAVAGMEGALASVIGGLVGCPVIGLPTSVGYGTSFRGVTALLSMLNSCAGGVAVVNIDNGFGAGLLASRMNNMEG